MTGVRLVILNAPAEFNPHYADTFALDGAHCPVCCELAIEAWERMTNGGLKVPCLPGSPYAHAIEKPTLTCAFIADFGPSEWT